MWIPKWVRDRKKGVESAMPTQVVSNEEFIPRPQTKQQKQVEYLIGEMAEEKAKTLGMERRAFMASSMGLATCFLANNMVFGSKLLGRRRSRDPRAGRLRGEVSQGRILHHRRAGPLHQRRWPSASATWSSSRTWASSSTTRPRPTPSPTSSRRCSSTARPSCWSSPACRATKSQYDKEGKPLEGPKRGGGVLPSWLMSPRKKDINDMAGSVRALCQGNCAPNHYWDMKTNTPGQEGAVRADGARESSCTASTPGSGTATPIRAAAATASSSTTRR